MSWPFVHAGETVSLRVPNIRTTGGVIDLAAATAMEFQVRRYPREPGQEDDDADNPVILSKVIDGDGITYEGADNQDALINLVAADTRDLAGWYFADFWVTIADVPFLVKADRWEVKQVANRV